MIVLDGKSLAKELQTKLRERVARLGGAAPGITLFRVGEDPASVVYVRNKDQASAEVGLRSRIVALPVETSEAELLDRLGAANRDPETDGILVQLPLPVHIRADVITDAIAPAKDVDGLHPANQGLLAQGRPHLIACTPLGVLALLARHGVRLSGARVVIVGRSNIVGRPLSMLLGMKSPWTNATVTVAHSQSRGLPEICRAADVLVAAIGQPRVIGKDFVKPGAAVVDVGIHRIDDPDRPGKTRLCGDVDANAISDTVGYLSPVPGGVGPLTVTMLLANTVQAAETTRGLAPRPLWQDFLDELATG